MTDKCEWVKSVDDFGYDYFNAPNCDLDTDLIEMHPAHIGYKYCPYCGKPIEIRESDGE